MNDEATSKIFQTLGQSANKLSVKSALNPILWLSVILVPILLFFSYIFIGINITISYLLIGSVLFIISTCLIAYLYFMLFDSSKLQSEDYQVKTQALSVIQEKGHNLTQYDYNSINAITNPIYQLPDFSDARKEGEK